MSFFEIIGLITTSIVGLGLLFILATIVMDFVGYQKGARNTRDYCYSGPDHNEFWWTWYGIKTWFRSFKNGGGWSRTVADPEDDNYDLTVYENGKIVREPTRY
jgi:hypothetical protein